MIKKIKVSLVGRDHSLGRGVGFYTENLSKALAEIPGVILTDNNPDIIHYPFFDLFYSTLPNHSQKPTVVTIHDLTPLVMSNRYPKGLRGTFNLIRQWWSLRNVSAIITDSENSKRDIVRIFRLPDEKIFVTPLAVSDDYKKTPSESKINEVKSRYNLPDRFILTLAGGPNPNKNLPSLAEATDRLDIPLVIVGGGMNQEIVKPVHPELIDLVRLQVYNHLICPGFIPNEDFNSMLHLAEIYVQPSLYEGFGLPLLEAMTAGCLIVSSKTSSLPEIYHEQAITFNPKSLRSMERSLRKALCLSTTEKKRQIDMAKKRATDFDWIKTAKSTLGVYKYITHV